MPIKLKRWWWKQTGNIIALLDSYAKGDGGEVQKLTTAKIHDLLEQDPQRWKRIQ